MRQGSWKTWLLVVLAAGSLAGAAAWLVPLKALRRAHDLDPADLGQDSAAAAQVPLPTVALAIFRSLAIDYLWIRADTLKLEGQYFDALHLARLICALQPNLPSVWIFQAWNMAYNISVAMPTAPQRWNWVKAGYELLRDQGLRACPRQPEIYRELGWIFQHKLGGETDTYHRYYKERFAKEVMRVLGPAGGSNELLEALARAPRSWGEALAEPNVAGVCESLRRLDGRLGDREALAEFWLDYTTPPELLANPPSFSEELRRWVEAHQASPALGKLNAFIRAYAVRQQWKMSPGQMLEINRRYGPVNYDDPQRRRLSLDWRLPWSHALYWAHEGLPYTAPASDQQLRLWRGVYHAMQDLFHYGRLELYVYAPPPETAGRETGREVLEKERRPELRLFNSEDIRMFPAAYQTTLDVMQVFSDAGQNPPKSVQDASANLAWVGIENLYLMGRIEAAGAYYNDLRRRYPDNPDYRLSLDEFVRTRIVQEAEQIGPKRASEYVDALLRRGHQFYAQQNDEMASAFYARAEQVRRLYEVQRTPQGDRIMLPSLAEMALLAYKNFVYDPFVAPDLKQLLLQRLNLERLDLYQRLTDELKKERSSSDGSAPAP